MNFKYAFNDCNYYKPPKIKKYNNKNSISSNKEKNLSLISREVYRSIIMF